MKKPDKPDKPDKPEKKPAAKGIPKKTREEKKRDNERVFFRVCERIKAGESMRRAAQEEGVPHSDVMAWVRDKPEFADHYARACEARLLTLEDKLLFLCEQGHNVAALPEGGYAMLQAVKLEIDTLKWTLSKLMPKKYGERQAVALEGGKKPVEVACQLPPGAAVPLARALKQIWEEESD